MRAAIFSEHGGPDVVRIEAMERPEPGPGEVRIRVRASSMNHLDLWARRGLPFPIVMPHVGGSDVAGELDLAGPGVEAPPPGTRVMVDPSIDWSRYEEPRRGPAFPRPEYRVLGEHLQGGFAEYAVVPASNLLQLPDEVTFETAAASGLVFTTAWGALVVRGGLRPGEHLLVTGASGGVSTAAIQLGRRAGALVTAVTSGPENAQRVLELGANQVIDRTAGDFATLLKEATGRDGVDLVLDSVGAPLWKPLIQCLRPGGRIVTYGTTAGPEVTTDLRHVFWKRLSILGSTMASPADFVSAMRLVFQGQVVPVIDRVLPLEAVGEAHRILEGGGVFGKIVIRVD